MKAVIKALLNSYWAIEPQYAQSYSKIVEDIMSHKDIGILKNQEQGGKAQFLGSAGFLFDDEIETDEEKEGNINVIPLKGVVVKYDTMCEMGTSTMAQMLEEGEANEDVSFHLLDIDSGGGMVDGTAHLANTVLNAKKPVIAFINGMCASAAYWIASQADVIVFNDQTTIVGSIGTMIHYRDFTEAMKKAGVKDVSIYAEASTDKNIESEALDNGDERPMKHLLNRLNDQFLSAVKSGRPNINQEQTLTGKIFVGSESLDVGLVDREGTLSQAIDLGFSLSNNSMFQSEGEKKEFFADFGKFFGMTPKGEDKQKKEDEEMTEQLQSKIEELDSKIEGKNAELLVLQTELDGAKAEAEASKTEMAEAVTVLDGYKAELTKATGIIAGYKEKEATAADQEVATKTEVPESGKSNQYQAVVREPKNPFKREK